jgi:hypothetical protein
VILIDEERIVVVPLGQRLSGMDVDGGGELLLEVDVDRLLQWLQAAAASFRLHELEVGAYQNAGLGPYELDVTSYRLGAALITLDGAVYLVVPRGADAFLEESRNVEEHR